MLMIITLNVINVRLMQKKFFGNFSQYQMILKYCLFVHILQ